jgi:HlyD family secretion protein
VVFVVSLVGAGVWTYSAVQGRASAPAYRLARVERGPLASTVAATGALNAVITVQVGSQISGQIKQLLADFNSRVRKGDVIARLDPETFEAKVTQAQADVESAEASVLNAQASVERYRADAQNARAAYAEAKAQTAKAQVAVVDTKRALDRATELFARQLIAKSELDTAQAAYDSAVAQLESARAHDEAFASAIQSAIAQLRVAEAGVTSARANVKQKQAALHQAKVDLDHTTIEAPVDGVVISRAVDVGQTVAASLSAPTLFTIAKDLTKMQVEASVAEADVGQIKLDQAATFKVDAFPNETFRGKVVQIRKAAQVIQNVVTYTVIIAVDNPGGQLLPGMTANVKFIVGEKANVLKVPNAALRFRPPGATKIKEAKEGKEKTKDSAPTKDASGGSAESEASLEGQRDQLIQSLGLTEEQQKKLDLVLETSRQERKALRAQGLPAEERKARSRKIKESAAAQIRELLTPEQRARYDKLTAAPVADGKADAKAGTVGRVWVLNDDGEPQPIALRLGITDGSATEVLKGDLTEGQAVIVGAAGAGASGGGSSSRIKL